MGGSSLHERRLLSTKTDIVLTCITEKPMPARLVQVTIINHSDFPIEWQDDGRSHGDWQQPWYPSNLKSIAPGQRGSFRLESEGIATGAEGWTLFKVHVPSTNQGDKSEYFTLSFDRPFIGNFSRSIDYKYHDPRTQSQDHSGGTQAYVRDIGFGDIANMDQFPFVELGMGIGAAWTVPIIWWNESIPEHVIWGVEVRTAGASVASPLTASTQGIVYASTQQGDLIWNRHLGRLDGTFNWESNEGKKVGTGWTSKQIFAGGDGIIYVVQDNGDLLWYRHDGRTDGSFRWASNDGKKVGTGWNANHVFCGGEGILYAVMANGDLLWFRHDGRLDGSFKWASNEGKKVGTGWTAKHVFSGTNGVIYAVLDNGDLLWYRHDGRMDGTFRWASNEGKKVGAGWTGKHVFSGGPGIIYTIMANGDMLWYKHEGWADGTFRWVSNEGKKVGSGWNPRCVFAEDV